jgi:hypothetical protein
MDSLRALSYYYGQTADRQKPEFTGAFKIRTSAMTIGYYRTSSPVTALPMIMGWISLAPAKIREARGRVRSLRR